MRVLLLCTERYVLFDHDVANQRIYRLFWTTVDTSSYGRGGATANSGMLQRIRATQSRSLPYFFDRRTFEILLLYFAGQAGPFIMRCRVCRRAEIFSVCGTFWLRVPIYACAWLNLVVKSGLTRTWTSHQGRLSPLPITALLST